MPAFTLPGVAYLDYTITPAGEATYYGYESGKGDGFIFPVTTRFYYDAGQRPTGVVGLDPDATGALKYRAQRTTYNHPSGNGFSSYDLRYPHPSYLSAGDTLLYFNYSDYVDGWCISKSTCVETAP